VAQMQNLPPTLIQVAENDILRDEGEDYGRKLSDAGIDVTTVRYYYKSKNSARFTLNYISRLMIRMVSL